VQILLIFSNATTQRLGFAISVVYQLPLKVRLDCCFVLALVVSAWLYLIHVESEAALIAFERILLRC
jgi:hypothetical protein